MAADAAIRQMKTQPLLMGVLSGSRGSDRFSFQFIYELQCATTNLRTISRNFQTLSQRHQTIARHGATASRNYQASAGRFRLSLRKDQTELRSHQTLMRGSQTLLRDVKEIFAAAFLLLRGWTDFRANNWREMMSKPTEYLMTHEIVAMLEKTRPSLHLLRLFHACYAYVDRNKHLSVGLLALTGKPSCTVPCSVLAAITGSPEAKSNAWIRAAIKEGGWGSLFSTIDLEDSGNLLIFKFAPRLGPASLKNSKETVFAMLDSDEIRTISSANEVLFYTQAVMVGQANQPSFYIPNICPQNAPWTDNSKKSWLRIAARVGERLGQDYVIVPQWDPMTRAILQVRVKVATENTRWSAGCLFPRPPCPPVAVVQGGHFLCLSKGQLVERQNWTKVAEA